MLGPQSPAYLHVLQNISLISLSFFLLPLSTFILFLSYALNTVAPSPALRERERVLRSGNGFKPRRILVTGVGMSKGLTIARSFFSAGHTVFGADFEPTSCGRVSKSLAGYYVLQKPVADKKGGSEAYIESLIRIIAAEKIDLWVSCSGVASAVSDGEAKEAVEAKTKCKAIQFHVRHTKTLHEKNTFIDYVKELGLSTPDTHEVSSREEIMEILSRYEPGPDKSYIAKPIGVDDASRGDLTLLPRPTRFETEQHVARLKVDSTHPWILQEFIKGGEYCTHSIVVRGEVKLFCACPSSELLMYYEALPSDSVLTQSMLKFTKQVAEKSGSDFTGHLSFDFMVKEDDERRAKAGITDEVRLYPIECNPRAHTAVALYSRTPEMVDAYLSLIEPSENGLVTNGSNLPAGSTIVVPRQPPKVYWIGHDLVALLIWPVLSILYAFATGKKGDATINELQGNVATFLEHVVYWKDGGWELWDPLPWWWLYQVYWPYRFAMSLLAGRSGWWSRANVSTTKMFAC